MTTIVREVLVSCPPAHVFDALANIERLPEFSDMTVAVKNAPGRPVQVGDKFDQVVKVLGRELDTEWEVTEVTQNALLRVEGRSKSNGRASLTETLTPEGSGTRLRFEVDYDPPWGLLGEIADKMVFEKRHEEEAERLLNRLKEMCEGSAKA